MKDNYTQHHIDSLNKAIDYLEAVKKKRGQSAGDELERDVITQWQLGNRGKDGDWRCKSEK